MKLFYNLLPILEFIRDILIMIKVILVLAKCLKIRNYSRKKKYNLLEKIAVEILQFNI
jgi:hypothetical protein